MTNLKKQVCDFGGAIAAGLIMFLTLTIIDYFLNLNAELFKKILSSIAAGAVYFWEKLYIR